MDFKAMLEAARHGTLADFRSVWQPLDRATYPDVLDELVFVAVGNPAPVSRREIAQFLLENGGTGKWLNETDETPLHRLQEAPQLDPRQDGELLSRLIAAGADVNQDNLAGNIALAELLLARPLNDRGLTDFAAPYFAAPALDLERQHRSGVTWGGVLLNLARQQGLAAFASELAGYLHRRGMDDRPPQPGNVAPYPTFISGAGACATTKNVLWRGGRVRWMTRNRSQNPADNGWVILSDRDTQEYLADSYNWVIADFNRLCAIEPALIGIWDFPVGSDLQIVDDGLRKAIVDTATGREIPEERMYVPRAMRG